MPQQDIATGPDQSVVCDKGQAFGTKLKAATQLLAAKAPGQTVQDHRCQLLAQACIHPLQKYIRSATGDGSVGALGGDGDANSDMRSVRRFRETWRRMSAEHQVRQAVVRGPDNAGPLNSHRLVLQSLAVMRSLSPDYLRRFMAHVDSLMWLEQASRVPSPVAGKPKAVRKGRAKP